jgi:hypothetical protein
MALTQNDVVITQVAGTILIAGLLFIALPIISSLGHVITEGWKNLLGDAEPEKKKNDWATQESNLDAKLVWIRLQSGLDITDEQQALVGLTDEQLKAVYDRYDPFMRGSIGMEVTSLDDMPTLEELLSFDDTPEA